MDEVVNLVFIVGKVAAQGSLASRFHSPSSPTYVKRNVVKTSHSAGPVIITVPETLSVVGDCLSQDAVVTFPFVSSEFPRASRRTFGELWDGEYPVGFFMVYVHLFISTVSVRGHVFMGAALFLSAFQ